MTNQLSGSPESRRGRNDSDLRPEIASYLGRHGWMPGRPGQFGELWSLPSGHDARDIAIPFQVNVGSREFEALVWRLSLDEQRPAADVGQDLEEEFQDVQQYRIADSFVEDESVLLESAATVLDSARRLIRAAATTARKPKAYIGSAYSAPADEIASRARLSHTRRGSFVLPVVMPVEPPEILPNQILETQTEVKLEPGERRVTRTLASALSAINNIVIHQAREPDADDLMNMVQSGVSKELVSAVRAIATQAGVHAFESHFRWAAGIGTPGGVPERILIPEEAGGLLIRVEAKLKRAKPDLDQSVSGQIIEIRHLPGEPLGEVAVRTIRANRTAEVRITTTARVIQDATDWFKSGRAVLARGLVVTTPGRPLSMPNPSVMRPIDELFVDGFEPAPS